MANSEQVVNIDVKTSGAKEAAKEVTGLGKVLKNLSSAFSKVFSPAIVASYFKSAVQSSGALEKELLVLRLALGKLKAAVGDALAPLGAVLLPVMQKAVWAATQLVKAIGKVTSALFSQGNAARTTAKNQTDLIAANDKVKRSLAGFDEINQLDTADSTETEASPEPAANDTLTPQLQGVVDKILSLTAPLKEIDFSPAVAAFGRLKDAISPITQSLFGGLEWAWHNLLVPLAAWTIENVLPVFLDILGERLAFLNTIIMAFQPLANWLLNNFLIPIGQWTGEIILQALHWLVESLGNITTWIQENAKFVESIIIVLSSFAVAWELVKGAMWLANGAMGIWNTVSTLGTAITSAFSLAMNTLLTPINLIIVAIAAVIAIVVLLVKNWDTVKAVAIGVWESIKTAWAGAWSWFREKIIDPLTNGFKNMVNGIIGFLNALIGGVVSGVNGIVAVINKLSFQVPDWVPGLGGKSLGFQLNTVSTPQIPYLAKGAVLPANKPFLAVVGDQRNGTNVEAPLETIKHALSEVLALQDIGGETVVQVNFTGDLAQLARVLKPAIATETRRKGMSLAKGAV